MKINKTIAAALLSSALIFTLSACQNQGPFEEAGEEMDDAVENTGDAIDDVTDDN